jgi:hypothetical protein
MENMKWEYGFGSVPHNQGAEAGVTTDTPRLPDPIHRNSDSLSFSKAPVALFEGDNYTDASFVITSAGWWNDMSQMPNNGGNWQNRVASVRFAPGLSAEALAERFPGSHIVSAEHMRVKNGAKPRDGVYSATFVNPFQYGITLEVRSGDKQACNLNNIQYNGMLFKNGGSVSIGTNDPVVCYRRTADPSNPHSPLGQWTTVFLDDNNPHQTIEL